MDWTHPFAFVLWSGRGALLLFCLWGHPLGFCCAFLFSALLFGSVWFAPGSASGIPLDGWSVVSVCASFRARFTVSAEALVVLFIDTVDISGVRLLAHIKRHASFYAAVNRLELGCHERAHT